MADPLSLLFRMDRAPVLPSFERLAPPPPDDVVAAHIEARTSPGDIVVDLHGRGGWIARSAMDRARGAYTYEAGALTELLAELVLRPPDLRHFDATLNSLSAQGHGQIGLRQAINEWYMSRCPGCGRQVVVDEFIWDGDAPAPVRKSYRCTVCRDQAGGGEHRHAPTDADDAQRATASAPDGRYRDALRSRFPMLEARPDLADQVLALYTPRNLFALDALVHGVERDMRAAPIQAALRLALVHTLLPASRLSSYPGRVATLRIREGRVRAAGARQWREHNPWHLFEEGCRLVRAFSQRVSASSDRAVHARLGEDLESLLDGSSNVVVRRGSPSSADDGPSIPGGRLHGIDARARIRLVLSQPPVRWTQDNLAYAYLATSIAVGVEAAAELPLEGLVEPPPRSEWASDAAAWRRSLDAVRPLIAEDARVVLLLDGSGRSGLVAGVLGGVGAGYHLVNVVATELEDQMTGSLEFVLPGGLPDGDPRLAASAGTERTPFTMSEAERGVTDVAVEVLQARGEPAAFDRLLGEVLVGLDRRGILRRLAAPSAGHAGPAATPGPHDADRDGTEPASGGRSSVDHVGLLLELVVGELSRADHPRLMELEPGSWWLRDPGDIAAARLPLSDRLEWAVFSLLSTGGGLTELAFFDRVARLFHGHDTPDEALVRACLDSYRDRLTTDELITVEDLPARAGEHGELVGLLAEYGHRLGLRCWINRREQRRRYGAGLLADLLSEHEQRVFLPLVTSGDPEVLEAVDCIWYLRGKATFLWEVESTGMLAETILRRGRRIPTDEHLVRFLVIPPERADLVRLKIARSPVLRAAMREDNWHIVKSDHLRVLADRAAADLDALAPILGLDPEVERREEQLPLFA